MSTSSSTPTTELVALLGEFYTDAEAFVWLTSPQVQLDGATALDTISAGELPDVLLVLRRMQEGVYL